MSLEPNWSYLRNPFDNSTKGNFKRMAMLARDHHDKLKSARLLDADIMPIYATFLPDYTAFNAAFRQTHILDSKRQALTMQLTNSLTDLRKQVEDWDIRISFVYRPSTPEYVVLMGGGRTSFYMGTYEGQLASVTELAEKLLDYPNLEDIRLDVEAWLLVADTLRTDQQGEEGKLQKAQKEIERTRLALAQKMHFVFASLLVKYFDDPIEVENFYELKYLQRSSTTKNTTTASGATGVKLAANTRKTVFKGTFTDSDVFQIKNTGNVVLNIWLSDNETSPMPSDVSTISVGDTVTFYGDELSDGSPSLPFLIMANTDSNEGTAEIIKVVV